MIQSKFKEGQKVRVPELNIEGSLVKIYFDPDHKTNAYVICTVKLDAPPFPKNANLNQALEYITNISQNIETELKCVTVRLESEDEMELIT